MISIIVPTYNSEKYLAKCLDSIIAQTHKDFEVIVVNDGSQDGSGGIAKDYAASDHRIFYREQSNQGVSSARNVGIELSRGKYLLFVDADDYLDPDVLYTLYDAIEKDDLDCVTYMFRRVFSDNQPPILDVLGNGKLFYALNSPEDIANFLTGDGRIPFYSACTHILKRNIIVERGIRFATNIICGEDTLFSHTYALFIRKGCILSDFAAYNRLVHPLSCTGTKNDKWLHDVIQTLQMCQELHDFLKTKQLISLGSRVLSKMSWELVVSVALAEVNHPSPMQCSTVLNSRTMKRIVYPAILKYGSYRRKLLLGVFLFSRDMFRWCLAYK
jgi:glycosyltransferase involved in cell wall biosynthesis